MKKQALQINTWGKNVYVKIPVANSNHIKTFQSECAPGLIHSGSFFYPIDHQILKIMINNMKRRIFLGTTGAFVAGSLMASPLSEYALSKGEKIKYSLKEDSISYHTSSFCKIKFTLSFLGYE